MRFLITMVNTKSYMRRHAKHPPNCARQGRFQQPEMLICPKLSRPFSNSNHPWPIKNWSKASQPDEELLSEVPLLIMYKLELQPRHDELESASPPEKETDLANLVISVRLCQPSAENISSFFYLGTAHYQDIAKARYPF